MTFCWALLHMHIATCIFVEVSIEVFCPFLISLLSYCWVLWVLCRILDNSFLSNTCFTSIFFKSVACLASHSLDLWDIYIFLITTTLFMSVNSSLQVSLAAYLEPLEPCQIPTVSSFLYSSLYVQLNFIPGLSVFVPLLHLHLCWEFPLLILHFCKMSKGFITGPQAGNSNTTTHFAVYAGIRDVQWPLAVFERSDWSLVMMYIGYLHRDMWTGELWAKFVFYAITGNCGSWSPNHFGEGEEWCC